MTPAFYTSDTSGLSRPTGSEISLPGAGTPLRRGASWPWQIAVLLALVGAEWWLSGWVGEFFNWLAHRGELLVGLAGIAAWRWGWFGLQSARAMAYRYYTYPRVRRRALEAVQDRGPVPEVTILAVTFKEKPWITRTVFESVFKELASLEGLKRRPRVVVATGCDEDDAMIQRIYCECQRVEGRKPGACWPPELTLLRGDTGKRPALASALREIKRGNPDPEGVVVFMDGDTLMESGLLKKVLPVFRLQNEVSAVTTNENGWVQGPRWFAEWISLRFGLRHRTMCSVAFSGRLLCLTGRLSVFRASVTSDPSFLNQVEHDSIHHWLWDSFDMLSGDDKSTWYWLAARGHRMLYIPDAMATTLEVVKGSAVNRALANIRRWSGNSLRHSWRAFKLGPRKLGAFCWYSLLDQRIAIGTVLVGPTSALLALAAGAYEIAAGYCLWVLLSRLAHASIAWWHGRRFSALYLPLQILSDWSIALTKVWVLFHPAKQAWMNRGARKLDSTRADAYFRLRSAAAHYLCAGTCAAGIALVGLHTGLIPLFRDMELFSASSVNNAANSNSSKPINPEQETERSTSDSTGSAASTGLVLFGELPVVSTPAPTSAPAQGSSSSILEWGRSTAQREPQLNSPLKL